LYFHSIASYHHDIENTVALRPTGWLFVKKIHINLGGALQASMNKMELFLI